MPQAGTSEIISPHPPSLLVLRRSLTARDSDTLSTCTLHVLEETDGLHMDVDMNVHVDINMNISVSESPAVRLSPTTAHDVGLVACRRVWFVSGSVRPYDMSMGNDDSLAQALASSFLVRLVGVCMCAMIDVSGQRMIWSAGDYAVVIRNVCRCSACSTQQKQWLVITHHLRLSVSPSPVSQSVSQSMPSLAAVAVRRRRPPPLTVHFSSPSLPSLLPLLLVSFII